MNDTERAPDCNQVLEQLLKLLHLSYDELMIFERAFGSIQAKTNKPVADVIKGEIECQKGLLKILIYISEFMRQ